MKLKDVSIDLTGLFKSSIENNLILCSGLSLEVPGTDSERTEVYELNVISFNETKALVKEIVMAAFYDNEKDGLIFGYKNLKLIVESVSYDKILLNDTSGAKYFIERVKISF